MAAQVPYEQALVFEPGTRAAAKLQDTHTQGARPQDELSRETVLNTRACSQGTAGGRLCFYGSCARLNIYVNSLVNRIFLSRCSQHWARHEKKHQLQDYE